MGGKSAQQNPAQYNQTGSAASQAIFPGQSGGGGFGWGDAAKYGAGGLLNGSATIGSMTGGIGIPGLGGGAGGKKSQAPPPPNYMAAAEQQAQSGQQSINSQTQANRPNINTGFGSESWTKDANGNWTLNSSLNPALGGALGSLQSQAATNAATGPQSIAQARQQAIDANYGQAVSRLNPQFAQSDEQLGSQLANQGLDPGGAAYRQAMDTASRAKNDAYSSAMNNAIGMGNQTEAMDLQAMMSPYQQMGALQSFQNGMPQFNAAGAWQPTQYLPAAEAAGNYGMGATQMNNQNQADFWNGAASLAGPAMMASDERIKSDVKRLPVEAHPGVPMATFKYKHDPSGQHHLGVIAQDVEKVAPQHVQTGHDGIKRVNYAALKPFGFGK